MIAKAQNGKMLKFLTIKPSGFNLSEICHGILLWEDDPNKIKKMTRSKMIETFKKGFLDGGYNALDYAWERIDNYDDKIETLKKLVSNHFANLEDC